MDSFQITNTSNITTTNVATSVPTTWLVSDMSVIGPPISTSTTIASPAFTSIPLVSPQPLLPVVPVDAVDLAKLFGSRGPSAIIKDEPTAEQTFADAVERIGLAAMVEMLAAAAAAALPVAAPSTATAPAIPARALAHRKQKVGILVPFWD